MSHRNYSMFSQNRNNQNSNIQNEQSKTEQTLTTQELNNIEVPDGIVNLYAKINVKLNVREKPSIDANIVHKLEDGTKVFIDFEKSTEDFYKIKVCDSASEIDGYCMKKFIETLNKQA